jgi:hypothetical protein
VILGFRYRTLNGQEFPGTYRSDIASPMYVMSEGDKFPLRYNPARPERYWSDLYGLGLGDRSLFVTLWPIALVTILILLLSDTGHSAP